MSACTAPGCARPALAGGLCAAHYQRKRRGRPTDTPVGQPSNGKSPERRAAPIHITLPPDVYAAICEAARVRGTTPGRVARDELTRVFKSDTPREG